LKATDAKPKASTQIGYTEKTNKKNNKKTDLNKNFFDRIFIFVTENQSAKIKLGDLCDAVTTHGRNAFLHHYEQVISIRNRSKFVGNQTKNQCLGDSRFRLQYHFRGSVQYTPHLFIDT